MLEGVNQFKTCQVKYNNSQASYHNSHDEADLKTLNQILQYHMT